MWTENFQMFQPDLEKAEEPEIKLPSSTGSSNKQEFQIYFCFIDYAKVFDCVDHNNCRKFLKRWDYQIILPSSWEICMWFKKQQLELDMELWNGSKLRKEYVKAVYCHPAYLTDAEYMMWSAGLDEEQAGINQYCQEKYQ